MQQELGSIISYCKAINNITIYEDEVPENFTRPSMFFPTLISDSAMKTKDFSSTDYTLYIKVFGTDSDNTGDLTDNIRKAIISDLYKIPLLDYEGIETGGYIRISKLNIRSLDIDIKQITLDFEMEG